MTGNGATTRRLPSWIESFLEYTADTPAPEIFRLWSAIGTVGAAMERRVWVRVSNQVAFPNFFILLVGKPGTGKSRALNPATRALKKAGSFHVAPKDINRATFIKWLSDEKTRDRMVVGDAHLEEYHSGVLHLSEFGVFIRQHDLDLLSVLCEIFDCPDDFENRRIYQGKDTISIPNPQISILAGTQPGYMASIFPPEAWTQGFMSRVIMIHCAKPARPSLFRSKPMDPKLESSLISDLLLMKQMHGEFDFTDEAKAALEAWYGEDGECSGSGTFPVPNYPRLENYNTRRIEHVLKLCQVSAASRSNRLMIELEDFECALEWLLVAEKEMPNVFLEMAGRSDSDTLREMWHYAWANYVGKKQAMHHTRLMGFLSVRVPAFQADKILEMAVKAGYFKKEKDMYTPRPKNEWGQV